jgi:outer membrane protein
MAATILAAAMATPFAQADMILGGTIEAAYWLGGVGGDASAAGSTIDMEDDLGFEDDKFTFFAVSLEHPVPVLPNFRIERAGLDLEEDGTLSVGFDGINPSTNVRTTLDLSHMDFILYYEVLDNWVSLDLGLAAKKFDGELSIRDQAGVQTPSLTEIDETIPLLYVAAEFAMPFTDMSVGASVSGASYSGNSLYDARVRLRQGISLAFVELGYRSMAAQIEDLDDVDVDIDLSGVYLSVGLDF